MKPGLRISLSLTAFRCFWGLLMFLHVTHAIAYSYEAWEYTNVTAIGSDLNTLLRVFRLGDFFKSRVAMCVLVSSVLIAAIHATSLFRALYWSAKLRRPAFSAPSLLRTQLTFKAAPNGLLDRLVGVLRSTWAAVFAMESHHFHSVRDARKVVEIASQTYSMFIMGKNVSSKPLYGYVGITLTLNCWSTPLIHHIWRHDEIRRRFFRLLIGVLLGCCFTIITPFIGYAAFKADRRHPRWFDIAWSTSFLAQLQDLMIDSWLEFCASRLNALMIAVGIETLKTRVQSSDVAASPAPSPIAVAPCEAAVTNAAARAPIAATLVSVRPLHRKRRRFFFAGYGLVILALTVNSLARSPFSESRADGKGAICHVEVQPWFQRRSSCWALEINCQRMEMNGSATEIGLELRNVEMRQVAALIFSNCAHLEMPTELQSLSRLKALEVFNSGIRSWNKSAAIVSALHPHFVTLRMILVTGVRELPPGLQVPTFPASDVEFSLTDLGSLPSDLDEKWPSMMERLTIEGSHLTQVPVALSKISFAWLLLGSNWIQQVPASLFVNRSYSALMLSGNPIHELPASLGSANSSSSSSSSTAGVCDILMLHLTGIQEIPAWTRARVGTIYAGSTLFCLTNRNATSWPSNDSVAPQIDCTPYLAPVALTFQVLELAQQRAPELVAVLLKKLQS